MKTTIFRTLTASLLLVLAGCTTFHNAPPRLTAHNGSFLKKTYYNAEVEAADGTRVRMTVYQPRLNLKKGETAPLLIHAHGFGLSRMARPLSLYGQMLVAGTAAQQAWDEGYFVISFDQRGHGASEGSVGLIRPEQEGADVSRLIDWAVRYLPVTLKDNDPLVGMIGESYGGGVQMMATVQDKRIDALVPLTTWFNLDDSLFPNGVPKSDWLVFLGSVGFTMNPLHMDGGVSQGVMSELFGKGDAQLHQQLRRNSLVEHCGSGTGPHADALLIQGMRDVLFPLNHALDARQCFTQAGRDARLIAVEHGHLMPGSQWSPGLPAWHMQKEVSCNGKTLQTQAVILDWLNGKLRADAAALQRVPTVCVTGDAAVDARLVANEGEWKEIPKVHVGSGMSGMFELGAKTLDSVGNLFLPARVPEDWAQADNGWLRPARVPLYTSDKTSWVAGVPRVSLIFSEVDRADAVLFLHMAKWQPGAGSYEILNQQVRPANAKGVLEFDLPAIRTQLQPGEVLGLIVTGYSNQFRMTGSGLGTDASISGRIRVPVLGAGTESLAATASGSTTRTE